MIVQKQLFASAFALLVGTAVNAQITLEHQYDEQVTAHEVAEDEHFYVYAENNTVFIYDIDHVLYKSVNLNPDQDYELQRIALLSRNLFDTDSDLEFIAHYYKQNAGVLEYYGELTDENGNKSMRFDDGFSSFAFNTEDGPKLNVTNRELQGTSFSISSDIYSLPGSLVSGMIAPDEDVEHQLKAYPNPTSGMLRIESSGDQPIQILNSAGQTIQTLQNQKSVNLGHLPRGLYIIKQGEERFKVVKE